MSEYFAGNLSPRVTKTIVQQTSKEYTFKESPIAFGMEYMPMKLLQLSQADQENLKNPSGFFNALSMTMDEEGNTKAHQMVQCTESNVVDDFENYVCIDSDEGIKIKSDFKGNTSPLFLVLGRCQMFTDYYDHDCVDRNIQDTMLEELTFMFTIDFFTSEFDTNKEEFKYSMRRTYNPGDIGNAVMAEVMLQEGFTRFDKSFLIASEPEEINHIQHVDIMMNSISQTHLQNKFVGLFDIVQPEDILMILQIKIDLQENITHVEYVKFPEVLAMFLGIFNMLLAIGILGKLTSQAVIIEEIMDSILFSEYKQTAFSLRQFQQQQALKKDPNYDPSNDKEMKIIQSDHSIQSLIQINVGYLKDKIVNKMTKSKKSVQSEENVELLEHQQNMKKVYNGMKEKSYEFTSILEMYKNIGLIKNGLQLLLDKDQWAALLHCGKRVPSIIEGQDNLNHLEQIEQLQMNEEVQYDLVKNYFIKRVQENPDKASQLDKKIFDCLLNDDYFKQQVDLLNKKKSKENSKKNLNDLQLQEKEEQQQQQDDIETHKEQINAKQIIDENDDGQQNLQQLVAKNINSNSQQNYQNHQEEHDTLTQQNLEENNEKLNEDHAD